MSGRTLEIPSRPCSNFCWQNYFMKYEEVLGVSSRLISFGVQSIKHANVLSEKINFSALGGSKVAIFGGDDLDPIYFEVHMFLNPPGPPYMSKNAQMCYF